MPKLPMMPMMPPQPTLPPRSRPVFAYPAVAHYKGTGSIDEAASFEARP
jgi:feruloyl esterase